MSHIEILVPFALPPAELAVDLLRELQLPALAMLLARARRLPTSVDNSRYPDADTHDSFARSLPHEAWLAQRFGMAAALQAGGSPPLAAARMCALDMHPEPGCWFMLQPVHYHIARDHLVLTDLRQLALADADARALFAAAVPAFEEAGLTLRYGTADCWFVRADRHCDLQTATPDATCGRNIDIWMPEGESARAWRKLQNEVQMEWHAHPVNNARAEAGLTPVNSVWLWGGQEWAGANPVISPEALFCFKDWFAAFGEFAAPHQAHVPDAGPEQVLAHAASTRLLLLDNLTGPALAGDWAEWLLQLQALETRWFAPLLAALTAGRIDAISLILNHGTRLQHWSASRTALRKFWCKPTLKRLLP